MTAQDIITNEFETQVDDATELSSDQELQVLNRVYQKISRERPWASLRVPASGTILSDANGYYITIPADFAFFARNYGETDNSMPNYDVSQPSVIFIGSTFTPVHVVNYADRRQYRNRSGFAWLDLAAGKIYFSWTPTDTAYDFDYYKFPANLTLSDEPWMPESFHPMLAHGMAVEDEIIQKSPKASSYLAENQAKFNSDLADLQYWNAQFDFS